MTAIDNTIDRETVHRPKYWSVRRIAERWCCSASKVYHAIYAQKDENGVVQPPRLPSIKFDGMVRVRDEDLQEFERCNTKSIVSADTGESGSRSMDAVARTNADLRLMQIAGRRAKTKRNARSASST